MTTLSTAAAPPPDNPAVPPSPTGALDEAPSSCSLIGPCFLLYVQASPRRDNNTNRTPRFRAASGFVVWVTVVNRLICGSGYLRLYGCCGSAASASSPLTTTGYGLEAISAPGGRSAVLFAILLALGACSGSTAGGLKIFRVQVAFALFKKQMRQLMHPSGVFPRSTTAARSTTPSSAP